MVSSERKQVSKITFTVIFFEFPAFFAALTTPAISFVIESKFCDKAAPLFITISTSSAPFLTARSVSEDLSSVVVAPSGKPITVQIFTSVPASSFLQSGTKIGFMHTDLKL